MSRHNLRRLIVRGMVQRHDGAVLLIRRCDGGYLDGAWEMPGGRANAGESPRRALRREVMEETGIEVIAADHLHSRSWRTPRGVSVRELTFACQPCGSVEVILSGEHDDYFWATAGHLPEGQMTDQVALYLPGAPPLAA